MAHSLFEPAPEPLSERLWRHMKCLKQTPPSGPWTTETQTGLKNLDARGQQLLLDEMFVALKK